MVVGVPESVATLLEDVVLGNGHEPGAVPARLVSVKPGGNDPEVTHHMSGPTPPAATMEEL